MPRGIYKHKNIIPREIRICAHLDCNNTFECKINSKRRYCDDYRCHRQSKETIEKRSKSNTIPREIIVCANPDCTIVLERPIRGKGSKRKYCSIGCSNRDKKHPSQSEEHIRKRIKARRNNGKPWNSEETNKKIEEGNSGKKRSEEFRRKKSIDMLRLWQDPEYLEMSKERNKRIADSHRGVSSPIKGVSTHDRKWRENHREMMLNLWQDPEYKEKRLKVIFKGLKLLPNKPEKFLDKLFQQLFPNQIKYTGDGKDKDSFIGGRCPDFICINQKKIIEHFGDYHHGEGRTGVPNEQHEQERIDYFTKYGYQTLIIWQHELEYYDVLIEKLNIFVEV